MILVTLDYIFEPDDSCSSMDDDRKPGLATQSHSMIGYLEGNKLEGRILRFKNLEYAVSMATLNPNID